MSRRWFIVRRVNRGKAREIGKFSDAAECGKWNRAVVAASDPVTAINHSTIADHPSTIALMSRVFVTHTSHFVRGPDGRVYASNTLLARSFWSRYLSTFDAVRVAARVRRVDRAPDALPRADGDGVEFADLPDYRGPWQYLARRGEVISRMREALVGCDAYCLRVPCANATLAWKMLRRRGTPFGLEVVGDPSDSLAAGGVKSIVRPVACAQAVSNLRRQCAEACAAAYVTRETLQRSYPPSPSAFTTNYSSIELLPDAIVARTRDSFVKASRLIFVGSLAVLYKGPDVLLRALPLCQGMTPSLTLIGDGVRRAALERLAAALGVVEKVHFAGRLPAGEAIRKALDAADLFVLPSRADALPRALIEAMARGLPCIATRVGGIPELLDDADLVTPGSEAELAGKISEFLSDPQRMLRAAERNLRRAADYAAPLLEARRREFYAQLFRRSAAR